MGSSPGSVVIDSAGQAWAHVRSTLFSRFNLSLWLKLAFIAMLGSPMGGGGGGGSVNVPNPGGEDPGLGGEAIQWAQHAMEFVRENIASLLALIIGLAILWIVVTFAIFYIRCVFRFIFVDAVRMGGKRSIRQAWGQHSGQGLSLLLWYLVVGLVPALLGALAILPIVISGVGVASGEAILAAIGVGGLVLVIGLILLAAISMGLIQTLTRDFLVPAMYATGGGVWESWRVVREAWRGRFWDVVVYYLLRLAVGMGVGFVGLLMIVPMMLLLMPAVLSAGGMVAAAAATGMDAPSIALYVGPALVVCGGAFFVVLSYLSQCVFLPFSVFLQAYALAFVGNLDARLRTL